MLRPSIEKLTLCGYIIVLVSIQLPVDPNKPILLFYKEYMYV